MDKRWMEAVAVSAVLVCGCGDEAERMPWMQPAIDDAAAGASGEALAGAGGQGNTSGSGGNSAETTDPARPEECDPQGPDAMPVDGAMVDAGAMAETMDAGLMEPPPIQDADAGSDSNLGTGGTNGAEGEAIVDAGANPPSTPRAPAMPGEVVISEVMLDPTELGDAVGEWFELHNPTSVDLDLLDCMLSDDRSDDVRLSALALPAGGYVVLGRSMEAASHVDQVYRGMVLANTSDEIVVTCGDVVIDRVAYGPGFPRPAGKSMQLDPNRLTAQGNDEATGWCASTDNGTPGARNVGCASL